MHTYMYTYMHTCIHTYIQRHLEHPWLWWSVSQTQWGDTQWRCLLTNSHELSHTLSHELLVCVDGIIILRTPSGGHPVKESVHKVSRTLSQRDNVTDSLMHCLLSHMVSHKDSLTRCCLLTKSHELSHILSHKLLVCVDGIIILSTSKDSQTLSHIVSRTLGACWWCHDCIYTQWRSSLSPT